MGRGSNCSTTATTKSVLQQTLLESVRGCIYKLAWATLKEWLIMYISSSFYLFFVFLINALVSKFIFDRILNCELKIVLAKIYCTIVFTVYIMILLVKLSTYSLVSLKEGISVQLNACNSETDITFDTQKPIHEENPDT